MIQKVAKNVLFTKMIQKVVKMCYFAHSVIIVFIAGIHMDLSSILYKHKGIPYKYIRTFIYN